MGSNNMSSNGMTSKHASVVVTGASRGIGLAIAQRFHADGAQVTICARGAAALEEARDAMPEVRAHACDMARRDDVERFANTVLAETGTPDVLVNNAGAFLPGGISSEDEGTFDAMIAVNLASAYHLTRALLPGMIARGSGTILNICSTASITPYPNGGSYGIAKHALLGFSRTLREEMKPHGIRVVALLPGATLTDSWAGAGLPYSRFMPAEDVAEAAFMAWRMSPRTVVEDILLRPMLGDIPAD
jgi:NAD(P)-dependent dehydrogenase (short-subunit alcohol dehydrogenase family)